MDGNKLKYMRVKRGYTQQQLADKLSITREFISAIERGKRRPSMAMLERIANVLDCSIKNFF